ncbi:hypothetical protein [Sulfitobacter sp. M13]
MAEENQKAQSSLSAHEEAGICHLSIARQNGRQFHPEKRKNRSRYNTDLPHHLHQPTPTSNRFCHAAHVSMSGYAILGALHGQTEKSNNGDRRACRKPHGMQTVVKTPTPTTTQR